MVSKLFLVEMAFGGNGNRIFFVFGGNGQYYFGGHWELLQPHYLFKQET
jgi:hypothetical protein